MAVKGNRKRPRSGDTGQIIDLTEEKVYDLDLKKKTYKVVTFAELRRQMEEAQKKARRRKRARTKPAERQGADGREPAETATRRRKSRSTSTSRTPARRRTINGFDTTQSMMTITVREKGKTLEQSGGMVMTTDMWLAPAMPAMNEVADVRPEVRAEALRPDGRAARRRRTWRRRWRCIRR